MLLLQAKQAQKRQESYLNPGPMMNEPNTAASSQAPIRVVRQLWLTRKTSFSEVCATLAEIEYPEKLQVYVWYFRRNSGSSQKTFLLPDWS